MIAIAPSASALRTDPRQLWTFAVGAVAVIMATAIAGRSTAVAGLALLAVGGTMLITVTAWRPAIGCAALALIVPLTAGLGRDTLIPLARTSEAATACVAIGLLLRSLPRKGSGRFTGLDLAVAGFCVAGVAIPSLVLWINHEPTGIDVWRVVLAPAQYLALYLIFSRAGLDSRSRRIVINLALLASVIVAFVGLAQLADVPGVRAFIDGTFPLTGLPAPVCQFGVCRPTSLLEHWSAFGGYALLNYLLALALASRKDTRFSTPWLSLVMAANAVAVLASQTQAAVVGLVVGTVVITWHARRTPGRPLGVTLAAMGLGLALFWPQVSARIQQQFFAGGTTASSPASLETRYQYWSDYFIPILADHALTGTGTVLPSEVPDALTTYVDNEYFRLAFRAGLIGVALLIVMLATIGLVGWRARAGPAQLTAAVGAAALGYVLVLAIMGGTAEYLTFAGVSQQFWMVIGLFAGLQLVHHAEARVTVLQSSSPSPNRLRAAWASVSASRQVSLVRSSGVVFTGNAATRLLGFVFSIAVARILLPHDYGVFAYALAAANIAAILVTNAPYGLSRALPLSRGDREAQDRYFSNVVVLVVLMVVASTVVTLPIAWLARIHDGLLIGVLANILGVAVLQTYIHAQRGQQRFFAMIMPYLLANLAQLVGILALAAIGIRSAEAFLIIYGLSSVFAVALLYPMLPFGLRFLRAEVRAEGMRAIARFVSPLMLHTAFFTVWFSADVVMVSRMVSARDAGIYAAAKAMAAVVALGPTAVAAVLLPRVAALHASDLRQALMPAIVIVAIVTLPAVGVLIALGHPLIGLLFGRNYLDAVEPLRILSLGMALYGLYLVLEALWIGRGRPGVDATAAGLGMAATLISGLILVPHLRAPGAAIAFGLGALVQVAVLGLLTARSIRHWTGAPSAEAA